ncbi:hypothetical protein V9L05_24150 (plasmid) [Bernardetia sp. Wsw4-3y2]|uniref:hypothetical protein n=1 Tax=Bernardetia sp. Wsw4-3y2 TaxID=3127471 RepID=UPI0030CF20F2
MKILFFLFLLVLLSCNMSLTSNQENKQNNIDYRKNDDQQDTITNIDVQQLLGSSFILKLIPNKMYEYSEIEDSIFNKYDILYHDIESSKNHVYNTSKLYKDESHLFISLKHYNFKPVYIYQDENNIYEKVIMYADSAIRKNQEKVFFPRLDIVIFDKTGKKIDEVNIYYNFSNDLLAVDKLFFINKENDFIYTIIGRTDEEKTAFVEGEYKEYWAFDKIKKYTITKEGKFHLDD